ncbi:helix-turn-helix domain-containing protein [Paenibacillus sp. CC-CFT747]|nr:helix-turn-helix domain-containing protein [Paenibacillus sp. CC-CFT747]
MVDYINRCRIELAVRLLKEKDYTNSQLSDAVGINNEKYFCTLFKQHFGVSPQKFRRQHFRT